MIGCDKTAEVFHVLAVTVTFTIESTCSLFTSLYMYTVSTSGQLL